MTSHHQLSLNARGEALVNDDVSSGNDDVQELENEGTGHFS